MPGITEGGGQQQLFLNMQEDNNFLQCRICLLKVRKARMCPQCSKLACHDCLKTWMEQRNNECPHCRRQVPLSSFADCERFIDDLINVFKKIDKIQKPKQHCSEHDLQMQYYCAECKTPVCSDCCMFGSQHKNHTVTRLAKIYQQRKSRILTELTRFDRKIEQYKRNGMSIKLQLQKLLLLMQQKKGYIEAYFSNVLEKLDLEFKQKQGLVLSKFESNEEEIELLESLKETIVEDLESYSQNEVVDKTMEILNLIGELCERGVADVQIDSTFNTMQVQLKARYELAPGYQEFEFKLKYFSIADEAVVYSQPENLNGVFWRLKIYPRGNGKAKDQWLSVFLEMSQGYENDTKYEYKIELLNILNESESVTREYASQFEIGQCWGYNEFIQLSELKNGFLVGDTLTFKFFIRNPNYKCLCTDQKRYIDKLEVRVKELQRLVIDRNSSFEKVQEQKPSSDSERRINELYSQLFSKKQQLRNFLKPDPKLTTADKKPSSDSHQ